MVNRSSISSTHHSLLTDSRGEFSGCEPHITRLCYGSILVFVRNSLLRPECSSFSLPKWRVYVIVFIWTHQLESVYQSLGLSCISTTNKVIYRTPFRLILAYIIVWSSNLYVYRSISVATIESYRNN